MRKVISIAVMMLLGCIVACPNIMSKTIVANNSCIDIVLPHEYSAPAKKICQNASDVKKLLITHVDNTKLIYSIGLFTNLEELEVACLESLDKIPDEIGNLKKLKVINIDNSNGCSMNPQIPESIGNLVNLNTLILFGAQDPSFDDPSFNFKFRRTLPKSLSNLKKLEVLDIGRNYYGVIPDVVSKIPNLKKLNLSYNNLSDLPDSLLNLKKLSEVILDGNFDITCSKKKQMELTKKFKNIKLNFDNEYDCPDEKK